MFDVDDAEMQVPAWSQFVQQVQQAHRIHPAGDGDAHAMAGREHRVSGDGPEYAVLQHEHIFALREGAGDFRKVSTADRIGSMNMINRPETRKLCPPRMGKGDCPEPAEG